MTKALAPVLAVLLCTTGSVAAHDCAPSAPPGRFGTHVFERADRDRDGMISRAEWVGDELQRFDAFDVSRDGMVDAAELRAGQAAWRQRRFEARFRELDRNGDGLLASAELSLPPRRFAELDRDHDRRLTAAELRAMYVSSAPSSRAGWLLRRWDANGDGTLTRAEARTLAELRFSVRDQNADGSLSRSETRAASKARRLARRSAAEL